jgi:putative ABC transport system substrate-binding protein
MKKTIQKLWLGIAFLTLTSAILLFSDLDQRKNKNISNDRQYSSIAIMQSATSPLLDSYIAGIVDNLDYEGFIAQDRNNVRIFNAQRNIINADKIAQEIVNGPYDLIITSGEIAMQSFAKANVSVKKIHVFGAVSDSFRAGANITGTEPDQLPPYMTGIGATQPVKQTFQLLHELNGFVKSVGVLTNHADPNFDAGLSEARSICDEYGITLIETDLNNFVNGTDACKSMISKGVNVVWMGSDSISNAFAKDIIDVAAQSKIPVISTDPKAVLTGALFGLGVNYYDLGNRTAEMVIEIINGKKVSEIRFENVDSEQLEFNNEVLTNLGNPWAINRNVQEILDNHNIKNDTVNNSIDFAEYSEKGIKPKFRQIDRASHFLNIHKRFERPLKVAMLTLVENRSLEESQDGVEDGMQWSGLIKDVDYQMKKYSAQGEISQLTQIIDAIVNERPDVIVTVTTPAMLAVVSKVKDIPVVLTVTSDPDKLQVFRNGPQANICGVHDNPPLDKLIEMAENYIPDLKVVGIVYDGSQMNSVLSVEKLRKVGLEKNIQVLEATANSVTELGPATQSLIQRGAQIIVESADNLASTGFSTIHKVADDAGIPIFTTEPQLVAEGATGAIGDSFFEWGKQSGKMVAKVLAGIPPSRLGITETEIQIRIDPERKK